MIAATSFGDNGHAMRRTWRITVCTDSDAMQPPLEDIIDQLTTLDEYRVEAARMRDEGRNALAHSWDDEDQIARWEPPAPPIRPERRKHSEALEYAAVLRAILAHHRTNWIEPPARLAGLLKRMTAREVMNHEPDEMPVLRAAKAMCALAVTPDLAFSPSMMVYHYYIIRELYTPNAPEWSIGGARAGDAAMPSTYVTWQCIRAITGFHRSLLNTALLFGSLARVVEQRDQHFSAEIPAEWRRIDAGRQTLEIATTMAAVRDNLALRITHPAIEGTVDAAALDSLLDTMLTDLEREMQKRHADFTTAHDKVASRREAWIRFARGIADKRARERERKRNLRIDTAHAIALQALQRSVDWAQEGLDRLRSSATAVEKLRGLQHDFQTAAGETMRIMAPAVAYVSHVLDRELAKASASEFWDAPEMAFAAVAWGEAKGRWDDSRLARAAHHLSTRISDRGHFPSGQPVHTSVRGYVFRTMNADVITAFALLLRHVHTVDLDAGIVNRMIVYLRDTQQEGGHWRSEGAQPRMATASAVLAANAINEMLDERVNKLVFRYFSVKHPEDIELTLPDLFYPDYGLVLAPAKSHGRPLSPCFWNAFVLTSSE